MAHSSARRSGWRRRSSSRAAGETHTLLIRHAGLTPYSYGRYGVAVDIWSLGVTAIELVSGSPPYAGEPPMKVRLLSSPSVWRWCPLEWMVTTTATCHQVMLRVLQSDPPPPPRGTDAFQSLIVRCMRRDPDERPAAADLLSAAPLSDVAVGECEVRKSSKRYSPRCAVRAVHCCDGDVVLS